MVVALMCKKKLSILKGASDQFIVKLVKVEIIRLVVACLQIEPLITALRRKKPPWGANSCLNMNNFTAAQFLPRIDLRLSNSVMGV